MPGRGVRGWRVRPGSRIGEQAVHQVGVESQRMAAACRSGGGGSDDLLEVRDRYGLQLVDHRAHASQLRGLLHCLVPVGANGREDDQRRLVVAATGKVRHEL